MFGTSSSSQYLHPDYISPLPTTLDAKNSPLALLAQTCSSIGHDLGPTKHSPDKKSSKENQRSGSSASTNSSSVDEKKSTEERNRTSGSTGGERHATKSSTGHCNGKISSGGSGSKSTAKPSSIPHRKDVLSPTSTTREVNSSADKHGTSRSSSSLGQSGSGRDRDRTGGGSPGGESGAYNSRNDRRSTSPSKHQSSSSSSNLRNSSPSAIPPSFAGAVPPLLYPPPGALPQLPGAYPFPFDLFSYSAAAAAVAAAQNAAAAAAVAGKIPPSLLSSYLAGYPRSSLAPSDAQTTSIESCKDPYCSHCTMTPPRPGDEDRPCPHLGSSCPQCNRAKSIGATSAVSSGAPAISPHAASTAALSGLPSLYPGASLLYPGGPFGPLLPGGMLGSMPAYVCPVMLPGIQEVCGKRCSSSEEFIQHIRTHTPPFADPGVLGGAAYPSASQLALSSLSQRRSFYPLIDSLGPSTSSLRPSPYSHPSAGHSSLLSSRFHPYKSPLGSTDLSSGLSSYAASAQALEAYRTLHAQRALGAIAP